AAGDYMAWLADELPVELQPNAASLNAAYLAELADAFDGKDDFRGGLPELEDLDQKFESEWDDTPMEPMISFLMACGSGYDDVFVAVAADEAWGSLEEAIDEADADYDAIGEDDELDGYDPYGEGGDEGDLPDAPEGFCVDLEGQVADLRADLMFVVDDIDGEAELEAFVYTAMVPLDDWLVENVPAEL
ncbi:MAG: hypothetical protein QF739_11665, partial [Acidimicrobiales bacterium]|nr:hypothetical protein [Acidimicrobiales bacterium]